MIKKTKFSTITTAIATIAAIAAMGGIGGGTGLGQQQIALAQVPDLGGLFDEINGELTNYCPQVEQIRGLCPAIPVLGEPEGPVIPICPEDAPLPFLCSIEDLPSNPLDE